MLEYLKTVFDSLLLFALHLGNPGAFPKPLSAAQEREYLKLAAEGDEKARSLLIEHNLRLVSHIIKKYYASCSEQDDLISVGTIGLIKGIDSFNAGKGTRLATYAARCIENEVLMNFRASKKYAQDISMNEPIDMDSEGNPLTLMDVMCHEDTIADDIDLNIKSKLLYEYIEQLQDAREKNIIVLRYGLYNMPSKTQREIAKIFGISRSYVSRIEKKVIGELKAKFGAEAGEIT